MLRQYPHFSWNLDPSKEPAARFSEMEGGLIVTAPNLMLDMQAFCLDNPGSSFRANQERTMLFSDGEFYTVGEKPHAHPEIMFIPCDGGWQGFWDGNKIRILKSCDERDAAAWVSAYVRLIHSPHSHVIGSFYGLTYELGAISPDNSSLISSTEKNTVRFFSDLKSNRLLCSAIESSTVGEKQTTVSNFIIHECASLLTKKVVLDDSVLLNPLCAALMGDMAAMDEFSSAFYLLAPEYFPCVVGLALSDVGLPGLSNETRLQVATEMAAAIVQGVIQAFLSVAILRGQLKKDPIHNPTADYIFHAINLAIDKLRVELHRLPRRVYTTQPVMRLGRIDFE